MDHDELVATIATRIRAGELPSIVLRSVLAASPELDERDLGLFLQSAFDGPRLQQGIDEPHLVNYVWKWQRQKNSDSRDTHFNVWVIGELLRCNNLLHWDQEYIDAELKRVQPAIDAENAETRQKELEAISFENLAARIQALAGRLVCIGALWDGDTHSGWFIRLTAYVHDAGPLRRAQLGIVDFGVAQLFNGVPPRLPQARYADEVGRRLAERFGVRFYFPSPDEPEFQEMPWPESEP